MSFIPIDNCNKHIDTVSKHTISKMGPHVSSVGKQSSKRRITRCVSVSSDVLDINVQCRRSSIDLGDNKTENSLKESEVQLVIAGIPIGVTRNLKPGCHAIKDIINAIAPMLRSVAFHKTKIQQMHVRSKKYNQTSPLNRLIHFIFTPQPNRIFVVPSTLQLI